ncbi:MAG: sulfurtransferase TusA family protein [Thermodesulfobacteriota bacterium]|nr:sulfurtransferase TusA family protein [Thermodesulfobacteriota bacterium]
MKLLDLRGSISVFTLLKVSNTFRELPGGEILEVLWSNPETSPLIFKILPESSYEVIKMEEIKKDETWFRIQIKKYHMQT